MALVSVIFRSSNGRRIGFVALLLLLVLLVIVIDYFNVQRQQQFREGCARLGGVAVQVAGSGDLACVARVPFFGQ